MITTSNYYATPIILKEKDSGLDYRKLSETALCLAEDAVKSSDRNILIAGCFPPINVSFRPDLTPSKNEVEDFYETLADIYKNRVDVILCETMASIFEGDIAAKIATKYFERTWVSWNTRGLDPLLIPSGEKLYDAALEVSKYNLDCQLVNCAHANLITKSLEILKSCVSDIGVYANSSVHSPRNEKLEKYRERKVGIFTDPDLKMNDDLNKWEDIEKRIKSKINVINWILLYQSRLDRYIHGYNMDDGYKKLVDKVEKILNGNTQSAKIFNQYISGYLYQCT